MQSMILEHYTATEGPMDLGSGRDRTQPAYGYKPTGTWLSVKGAEDWHHWHVANGNRPAPFVHSVELSATAAILLIHDVDGLHALTSSHPGRQGGCWLAGETVDWESVSHQYDGIIIDRHIRTSDPLLAWYNTWDCASGCIWRMRAIATSRLLNLLPA
jgi:hypothetical protein